MFPAFSGTTYAFANFNSATGANDISNFLISPLATISNGDTISFYTRTVPTVGFPDRLELVYNTTGSLLPADFTNVLVSVNPTLTLTGYPTTWTQFTGTVSGLAAPVSGRFAFHYNPTGGGPAGANSDYIGVDDIVYTPAGGGSFATNTTTGAGCYRRLNSFYELFAAGTIDLSNTSWTLTQNGSGGYDVVAGGAAFSAPGVGATQVAGLGDDNQVAVGTLGLTIGSNGWVATGAGNSNGFTPTAALLLNNVADQLSFLWKDLNVTIAGSGQYFYEEVGNQAIITANGVFDFGGTTPNFVRIEMIVAAPGVIPLIQIGYGSLSLAGNTPCVGYSPGGPSNDPGSIDISASTLISTASPEVLPLTLTANTRPITNTNWSLTVSNSRLLDLVVIGGSDPNIPDLSLLGVPAPGCGLRASLDLISVGSTFSLAIPNNASLAGFPLFATGASLSTENAFGFVTSNGIAGVVGTF